MIPVNFSTTLVFSSGNYKFLCFRKPIRRDWLLWLIFFRINTTVTTCIIYEQVANRRCGAVVAPLRGRCGAFAGQLRDRCGVIAGPLGVGAVAGLLPGHCRAIVGPLWGRCGAIAGRFEKSVHRIIHGHIGPWSLFSKFGKSIFILLLLTNDA